jgi:hypothetical protein
MLDIKIPHTTHRICHVLHRLRVKIVSVQHSYPVDTDQLRHITMLQSVNILDTAPTILAKCYGYDNKLGYGDYSHGNISSLNIHKNALCMCFFVS